MIEVRLVEGRECMACDPPAEKSLLVVRVGGGRSTWSTYYCEDCAVKALQALMFIIGSNVNRRVITDALKATAKRLDGERHKAEQAAESVNRQVTESRGARARARIAAHRGPHWLNAIEDLKPGDACEFHYPARSNWCPAIVVVNGGSGYWEVRRTSSDEDGVDGEIVTGIYIEGIRLPGQTEAWR